MSHSHYFIVHMVTQNVTVTTVVTLYYSDEIVIFFVHNFVKVTVFVHVMNDSFSSAGDSSGPIFVPFSG